MTDVLSNYSKTPETFLGTTRDVYRRGTGPCVIVISEIPGITPKVIAFADEVVAAGFSVAMPRLFGKPGKEISAGYVLQSMAFACVSKEFYVFAAGKTSPATAWLRQLANAEHQRCGGPGVGVVGMCLTGGFALAMMVDPIVLAPVLSQPSLPAPLPGLKRNPGDLGISADDLAKVKARCAAEDDLCLLGLRFTGDPMVKADRFARLRAELGDSFVGVELDSSPGNAGGHPKNAHSVLTEHRVQSAVDQVLDLFRTKLAS